MRLDWNFIKSLMLRDLKRYFSNPTGYVFITLFIFLSAAAAFWQDRFFLNNLANLEQLNEVFPQLLLLFVPALTMSIWADERKQGTDELLLTMPASSLEVVLGKYLAALGVYTASLAFSLSHILVLFWLGRPDLGVIFANYTGYWLIGAALISVGLVASRLTSNATIAFILGALFCSLLVFIESIGGLLGSTAADWAAPLGVVVHFEDFARGVISLSGVFYFVSLAGVMIYLNVLLVDRRHWPKKLEGYPTKGHYAFRLCALVVALISFNAMIARGGFRLDVTAEQLHSLSRETHELLDQLEEERPVFVQAYISPEVPEAYVQARANLLNTLEEIDAVAGSKVQILIRDTQPFGEAAREARERFGILPREIPNLGSARAGVQEVFLGLAITSGAEEEVIPFLDRGLSAEYEVVRSIRVVADAERRKVGVLQTSLNLFGGLDFQTMQSSAAWPVVDELRKQYEVVQLSPGTPFPPDLDALMVALPSSLPQVQMDQLQEAIEGGLPTLLLVDPLPLVNLGLAPSEQAGANRNPFMQNQQAPPQPKGNIEQLMASLGVSWPKGALIWDSYNPHPALANLPPEVVFVGPGNGNEEAFNRENPITSALQELVLLYPGELNPAIDSSHEFRPLVQTGRLSGRFQYQQVVQRNFFGAQLNRNLPHIPDETVYTLAAEVKSAGGVEEPAEVEAVEEEEVSPAVGRAGVHVIVVADLDFISEQFFQIRAQGPRDLNFDNVAFFLNCVDVLAGDESFISLRGKRVRHRTLERVEAQTQDFIQQRIQEEEEAEAEAEAALRDAQQRLDQRVEQLQQRPDLDAQTKQIMARNLQEAENRRLEVLSANIEAEKEAKIHASEEEMEAQIRRIQSSIKTLAVLLPPIPVFLIGVVIFIRRQRREREGAAASRRLRG